MKSIRKSAYDKRNILNNANGKIGWLLLWGLGVPVPVLIVLFLVRGCT